MPLNHTHLKSLWEFTECMHIYGDKNGINIPKRYFHITLTFLI